MGLISIFFASCEKVLHYFMINRWCAKDFVWRGSDSKNCELDFPANDSHTRASRLLSRDNKDVIVSAQANVAAHQGEHQVFDSTEPTL